MTDDDKGVLLQALLNEFRSEVVEVAKIMEGPSENTTVPVIQAPLGTLREARVHFERAYVGWVLKQHQGRIPDAAKALGVQRTNLYRKMRQLRLLPPSRGLRVLV